ncbi:MAG TPA: DUF2330 domain-containing protein [Dehalococcoidia bacterium]|nr:DUF2330 domain-containing protein [Dehalococcoidia bacterium]
MRHLFRALLLVIFLSLITLPLASVALADRGMVPISDVSVYGPGQKAIIAWNGEEETLILSTDVSASDDSQVLELLPLPSKPEIKKGDFASFEQVNLLIEKHFPVTSWDWFKEGIGVMGLPGRGVEIVFHEKIGAHDITMVKADDSAELIQWAEEFLKSAGIEKQISSPKLESVVASYLDQNINYFVFDLIEVTSKPKSIEPIVYRFDTDFLYYPLKISTLAEGWTDINLFLLTPQPVSLHNLPGGSTLPQDMEVGKFYGSKGTQPIQFKVNEEELISIDESIAELLGSNAWLTAVSYHGDLAGLTEDLKITKVPFDAQLIFDYGLGSCASRQRSQATIGVSGDVIVICGSVIIPTPCYGLRAELNLPLTFAHQPIINIDITAQEKPGICIQCLGEIPFWAKIVNLKPGLYDIAVRYQDKVIGQKTVIMPLCGELEYLELSPQSTLEVGTARLEFIVQVDGEKLNSEVVIKARLNGDDSSSHLAYLQFNNVTREVIIEVDNVSAIVKISPECQLKIEDSQLFLNNGYWLLPIRVMPEKVVTDLEPGYTIELKATDDKAVYEVQGVSGKRLLGLVSTKINMVIEVDAATGEVISEQKPWWAYLCW